MNGSALMVGNFLSRHGGNRGVCEELALRLRDNGWRIRTTSCCRPRLARMGDMLMTAWRYRHTYEVAQIDVFSGPAFRWAEAVSRVLNVANRPYVLTLHGGSLPQFAARNPGRVCRLLTSAAAVTTPSYYLLEQMQPWCDEMILLPNAVDFVKSVVRQRSIARPRLIWLRALHEIYNPLLAARVVALLQPDVPEVSLRMVGPDKQDGSSQKLRNFIAAQNLGGRVEIVGGVHKSDVPRELDRGDVFLNTTNVDNTPVSVIEAMCGGLCIVSTNVGGVPYLLEHEHDALLVPPDDPQAMSAAVRRVLTEPGLAARLSRNATEKARQWDWSGILPRWDALLRRVGYRQPTTPTSLSSQASPACIASSSR